MACSASKRINSKLKKQSNNAAEALYLELLRHLIFIAYISTITGNIIGLRFVDVYKRHKQNRPVGNGFIRWDDQFTPYLFFGK